MQFVYKQEPLYYSLINVYEVLRIDKGSRCRAVH